MCGLDTESVSEADLTREQNPKTYLPETLIAGRQKRAIKKSIKLETEYFEWADDHQVVYGYVADPKIIARDLPSAEFVNILL